MRFIILSQWYVPEPDFKIHLLGRNLAQRGHRVTVITGFPNYPTGQLYPGYKIRWRQWEQRNGMRVLRVLLYPDHSWSVSWRILPEFRAVGSVDWRGAVRPTVRATVLKALSS